MPRADLISYLEEERKKGASIEQIAARLREAGWKDADIADARLSRVEEKVFGSSPVAASDVYPREGAGSSRLTVERVSQLAALVQGEKFAPLERKEPLAYAPQESMESKVTGKWFAALGILAILFGVGFFLKYAFDNNLIGETGRVIMGIFGGLMLLVIGDVFSRKERYREYSFYLSGGGLALLYLSIFAAYNYYHLIGQAGAFAVMIVITAIGAVLAVFSDSERLAAISLFGGFLTPFMVSSGIDNQIALFGYLLILDLGFLLMSYAKRWRKVYAIAFLGTYTLFFSWCANYYAEEKLWTTMTFLTAYFAIFLIAPFLVSVTRRQNSGADNLLITEINAAFYFATAYILLKPDYEPFMGFFFVLWAALCLLGSYILSAANSEDKNGILGLAGMGLVLVTVAIPIQLSGKWITIAWAAEGFVLTWIGIALGSQKIRTFANIVYVIAVIRLLGMDSSYSAWRDDYLAFMNSRFITFVFTALSLFGSAYISRDAKEKLAPEEKNIPDMLAVAGHLIAVAGLTVETIGYFDHKIYLASGQPASVFAGNSGRGYADSGSIQNQKNLALSLLWGAYSGLLMVVGIARRSRGTRLLAIAGFGVVIFKVFLYDVSALSQLYRIVSFITLGVILLVISFLFYRYKERFKELVME